MTDRKLLPLQVAVALGLLAGCDTKKPPPPAPATTTSATADNASVAPSSTIVAHPLGYQGPEDAGTEAGAPPKTGVCSYTDSGYDGQDSKYNERMIIKIKDDVIVGAEYRYRGGYAIDGKSESLHIPLQQKVWLPFELPMTSGTQKFSVRIRGTEDMDFKGVASKDAAGECMWEKPSEDAKDADKDKDKDKDEKGKKGAKAAKH